MTFVSSVVAWISGIIISIISALGYFGIIILMALESCNIPIPSEIIMPFAGYLAFLGEFSLLFVAIAGALGCTIGSIASYYIGYYGGRPLLNRYGKYILITEKELDKADNFFKKHGDKAAFFSRLLPVIRTFISLPAGIAKAEIKKFIIYTFIGSFIWSYFLALIGYKLGENWDTLGQYFHKFDILLLVIVVAFIAWFIYNRIKNHTKERQIREEKLNQI